MSETAVATVERHAPSAVTPMEMLNQAVERGASLEVLSKLMDLQERWESNQARKEFDADLAAAKAEITPIERNRQGHNSKWYADFAAIAKVVDPILSKYGLSYRFRTTQADGRISVTCVLAHRAGHNEETTLSGPADNSGNKNAIQSIGSTLTYLQRYSLVQMLGLAAAHDDDGKAAGAGDPVSDDQVEEISKALLDAKIGIERFLKNFKIEAISELPAKKFKEALDGIKEAKNWNAKHPSEASK